MSTTLWPGIRMTGTARGIPSTSSGSITGMSMRITSVLRLLELDHGSHAGSRILPEIVDTWRSSHAPTYYKDTIEVPDRLHRPDGYEKRKMG
ncbi:hypothetical protein ACRE_054040 [Hapsidospora chrysogenum ATCC 11550]|uniref:Uncharacterized protein n=1 Tax=Hapsidospora chrysogenum (strain ATCC 11550 / CBS 779.69 / DSM 880 / IAM 14645 / JCM 23072 / IMI 49137) TaxID=857340 RepID=A0A086T356_HAPC1|nr:hypothetical protein ACRE_054040 [Hapsidospora chrysogenum ATCC 11550]